MKEGQDQQEVVEEVEVDTALGRGLKKLLIADHRSGSGAGHSHSRGGISTSGTMIMSGNGRDKSITATNDSLSKPLLRTIYEFDVNPHSDRDVPVVVIKSRVEAKHHRYQDTYINCSLSSDLSCQLDALFKYGKLLTSKQRKKKELKETSGRSNSAATTGDPTINGIQPDADNTGPGQGASSSRSLQANNGSGSGQAMVTAVPKAPPPSMYDSIYDDDIVVGKYVPLGALDGDEATSSSSSSIDIGHPSSIGNPAAGQPSSSIVASVWGDDSCRRQGGPLSKEELMRPVQVVNPYISSSMMILVYVMCLLSLCLNTTDCLPGCQICLIYLRRH